jgi:hypothetical protein
MRATIEGQTLFHGSLYFKTFLQPKDNFSTVLANIFPLIYQQVPHLKALPPSTQKEKCSQMSSGPLKYNDNSLRLLTCVFGGVTTRIIGQTFNLTFSPEYYRWLENTCHNWLPMPPIYDLASQNSVLSQNSDQPVPAQLSQTPQQLLLICPLVAFVHPLTCQSAEICPNNNPNFPNPFLEEMIPYACGKGRVRTQDLGQDIMAASNPMTDVHLVTVITPGEQTRRQSILFRGL